LEQSENRGEEENSHLRIETPRKQS